MIRTFNVFFIFYFLVVVFGLGKVLAINKVNNWNFNGNSTGWSTLNGTSTDDCGNVDSLTGSTMATFGYSGNLSGQTAWQSTTAPVKNTAYHGNIYQTVVAPGSGTVKAKGKLSYYATATAWGSAWIRLDFYDSTNTNYVANIGCTKLNANVSWNTLNFSSDVGLTGGTTYAIRASMYAKTKSNSNTSITLGVDNINVNFAPTGLQITTPTDTTNARLDWTLSVGGSGASGLHASTPFKIYRNLVSPVTTFLSNGTTISYTDTSSVGNTNYYYAVTDIDTDGNESPKSSEVNVLTLPGAPTNISFSDVYGESLRVGWTAPNNGANSYKIENCYGASCDNFSQIASGYTGLYYDHLNLSQNFLYRYRIRATNNTGDGVFSAIGETTTGIFSVTITSNGLIEYGFLDPGGQKSTIDLTNTQTAQNDGTSLENLNIRTSNAIGGTLWSIGSSASPNIFVHEFSTDSGEIWTKFTDPDSYQTLATNLNIGQSINFDTRITAPTETDLQQKSITITVQVVSSK